MKYEELKALLPKVYESSKEMDAIMKVEGVEIGQLIQSIKEIMTQTYPHEVTWGLSKWEGIFNIKPQEGDSYEDRRARLISKIQFSSPLTPAQFKSNLNGFADRVVIQQYFSEYRVEFFLEKATFYRLSIIIKTIKEMIPAHLEWDIALKYHGEINFKTSYQRGWSSFLYANEYDSGEYWSSGEVEKNDPSIDTQYGAYDAGFAYCGEGVTEGQIERNIMSPGITYNAYDSQFGECGPSGASLSKSQQVIASVLQKFETSFLYSGTFICGEVSL